MLILLKEVYFDLTISWKLVILKVRSCRIEGQADLVPWPYDSLLSVRADDKQLVELTALVTVSHGTRDDQPWGSAGLLIQGLWQAHGFPLTDWELQMANKILFHGSSTSQAGEIEHISVPGLSGLLRRKAYKHERWVKFCDSEQHYASSACSFSCNCAASRADWGEIHHPLCVNSSLVRDRASVAFTHAQICRQIRASVRPWEERQTY